MREISRIPNENPKWIILDGDLDAVSIFDMCKTCIPIRHLIRSFEIFISNSLMIELDRIHELRNGRQQDAYPSI